jgi:hypothetical protein
MLFQHAWNNDGKRAPSTRLSDLEIEGCRDESARSMASFWFPPNVSPWTT